jgi:hypothetical protein
MWWPEVSGLTGCAHSCGGTGCVAQTGMSTPRAVKGVRDDACRCGRAYALAAAGFFDGGYVDLLHGHHGFEYALGFGATGGHAVG